MLFRPASLRLLASWRDPRAFRSDLQNGITGAVYVFDAFGNLITAPTPVTFQLSVPSEPTQTHSSVAHDGAAWTEMNSDAKEGNGEICGAGRRRFQHAHHPAGSGRSMRAENERIQAGNKIDLETDPLRDCSGNPVTDGTIVTFTEAWNGGETTVDAPVKHGVAEAEVPALNGVRLSVATGVVMGNEIRWENQQ